MTTKPYGSEWTLGDAFEMAHKQIPANERAAFFVTHGQPNGDNWEKLNTHKYRTFKEALIRGRVEVEADRNGMTSWLIC